MPDDHCPLVLENSRHTAVAEECRWRAAADARRRLAEDRADRPRNPTFCFGWSVTGTQDTERVANLARRGHGRAPAAVDEHPGKGQGVVPALKRWRDLLANPVLIQAATQGGTEPYGTDGRKAKVLIRAYEAPLSVTRQTDIWCLGVKRSGVQISPARQQKSRSGLVFVPALCFDGSPVITDRSQIVREPHTAGTSLYARQREKDPVRGTWS